MMFNLGDRVRYTAEFAAAVTRRKTGYADNSGVITASIFDNTRFQVAWRIGPSTWINGYNLERITDG